MSSDNPTCGAETKAGTPCKQPAGNRTSHAGTGRCWKHGGASPKAEIAGQVVLARREYQVMGVPVDITAQDALLECIRIAAGEVHYASARIAELDTAEAVGNVTSITRRPLKREGGAESTTAQAEEVRIDAPQLHVWIQVRQKAMDRLVSYSATALKHGLEERMVKVAEQQGELLARAVHGILSELGVVDRPEVPAVVRKHLTLLAG